MTLLWFPLLNVDIKLQETHARTRGWKWAHGKIIVRVGSFKRKTLN